MSLLQKLVDLEKKFAWSFLGFVLAAILGALALYSEFFKDTRPKLKFEILNNTNILDVKEKLGKLEIFYDDIDIKKSKQSLRVITLRVINYGHRDILQTHYDRKDLLGFEISTGRIIRTEVITASSDYLLKNLLLNITSQTIVTFSNVILDSKESFVVKALILHPEDAIPDLKPIGKIAGVKTIGISNLYEKPGSISFFRETFGGSVWIQAIRLLIYFIAFAALLLALASVFFAFVRGFLRYNRRKKVRKFKRVTEIDFTNGDNTIFYYYIYYGVDFLNTVNKLLSDETRLKKLLRTAKQKHGALLSYRFLLSEPAVKITNLEGIAFSFGRFGFVEFDGKNFTINEHMHNIIKELLNFLSSSNSRTKFID